MPKTRQYFQIDRPDVADLTTTINDYVLVPFPLDRETTRNYWDTWHLAGVKLLRFTAADNNLKVKVMGSIDGTNFTETVEAEFTVITTTPVTKRILPYWPYLQVQVKPAVAAQHGTLSILAIGTSITAEADTELTATIDPAGLATQATLADILAKIIAAPSTEAKQDLILTALGLIATEATAGDIKTAAEALAVATPDTAAGDLASMSADLGTIQADIATVKADIATVASNSEITPATVTGTCTAAYATALSLACAGVRNKTIVVVNTDAALTMKYRVRGFAKSGSSYYNEIQAEATLAASTSQPHVIENSYDVITVEVIGGTGHATYAIDYCGGQ